LKNKNKKKRLKKEDRKDNRCYAREFGLNRFHQRLCRRAWAPPRPPAETANDHQQPTLAPRNHKKLISLCQGKGKKNLSREKKIREQVRVREMKKKTTAASQS